MGSYREMVSVVGVKGGHQERNPEVAVSFCSVALWSMCLLTAWFVPYIAVSGDHRKKHQILLPEACGLAKEFRQIKRVKHRYSSTVINALIEGSTGYMRI